MYNLLGENVSTEEQKIESVVAFIMEKFSVSRSKAFQMLRAYREWLTAAAESTKNGK